ncbi:MAG: Crp/Fnr family transcriptional regulator [Flavobacteriaceae bacterium]|nr:Crp/Fnr family transcriptional regulator [Flavobacteriaceae bacterium]
MNSQNSNLQDKLSEYYSSIFEKELIDDIIKVGRFESIESGNLLIDIGQDLTHIPLILSGVVKIMRQENEDEELALYYLERGDTCAISFVNCIDHKRSIFRGIVEKDVEVVFLPVEVIDDWLQKHKTWRRFIIDSYHLRLLEMVDAIDGLAFMKLKNRMLKYLIEKVKITQENILDITHQEIANDLNSSRVVVSRMLKQLEQENKIEMRRNKIIIESF